LSSIHFATGINFYCVLSGGKSSHEIHGIGYRGNRIVAIRCN